MHNEIKSMTIDEAQKAAGEEAAYVASVGPIEMRLRKSSIGLFAACAFAIVFGVALLASGMLDLISPKGNTTLLSFFIFVVSSVVVAAVSFSLSKSESAFLSGHHRAKIVFAIVAIVNILVAALILYSGVRFDLMSVGLPLIFAFIVLTMIKDINREKRRCDSEVVLNNYAEALKVEHSSYEQ